MARADSSAETVEGGEETAGGLCVLVVISLPDDVVGEPWLVAVITEVVRQTFDRCDFVTSLTDGRMLAAVERDPFTENRIQEVDWLLRRRLPARCVPTMETVDLPGEC